MTNKPPSKPQTNQQTPTPLQKSDNSQVSLGHVDYTQKKQGPSVLTEVRLEGTRPPKK